MKGKQLREIMQHFGLTQQRTGDFLGYHPRSVGRWLLNELPVPRVVALLLATMTEKHVTPEQAEDYINH